LELGAGSNIVNRYLQTDKVQKYCRAADVEETVAHVSHATTKCRSKSKKKSTKAQQASVIDCQIPNESE